MYTMFEKFVIQWKYDAINISIEGNKGYARAYECFANLIHCRMEDIESILTEDQKQELVKMWS